MIVGSRSGPVHAYHPERGTVTTFLEDLNMPTGLGWRDGYLYVVPSGEVLRFAWPDVL